MLRCSPIPSRPRERCRPTSSPASARAERRSTRWSATFSICRASRRVASRWSPRPGASGRYLWRRWDTPAPPPRRRGITLSFEAPPPVFPTADAIQLGRAITNLLSNAIKYPPAGGRITIVADREDGWVALAFRDTGRGIPAEEIPHLFEKYR